jgi:hypothetical protein
VTKRWCPGRRRLLLPCQTGFLAIEWWTLGAGLSVCLATESVCVSFDVAIFYSAAATADGERISSSARRVTRTAEDSPR